MKAVHTSVRAAFFSFVGGSSTECFRSNVVRLFVEQFLEGRARNELRLLHRGNADGLAGGGVAAGASGAVNALEGAETDEGNGLAVSDGIDDFFKRN